MNPYPPDDADRRAIWDIIVLRDTDFFLSSDWSLVAEDYVPTGFLGIECGLSLNPADWRPAYPTVEMYRDAAIAGRWNPDDFAEPLREAWLACQSLSQIDIAGDAALAHKRIDGRIARRSVEPLELHWRSVFHLRRTGGRWRISGFNGYLPLH